LIPADAPDDDLDDNLDDDELDPPDVTPAAAPSWKVVAPDGWTWLKVAWDSRSVRLALTFECPANYRDFLAPQAGAGDEALARVRKGSEVQRWLAAEAERAAHQRRAGVARAKAEALAAQRRLLIVEGAGDVAQQLRAIDTELARLKAQVAEAEELARFAGEVAADRRAAARREVESSLGYGRATGHRAMEKRRAELLAELATRAGDLLTELVRVEVAMDSFAAGTIASAGPNVEGLLGRLSREASASAAATDV
jgi:hypothetical protein